MDYLVSAKQMLFADDLRIQDSSFEQVVIPDNKDHSISLDLQRIKPADRVTLLLNYLYLTLRNNQLMLSSYDSLRFV